MRAIVVIAMLASVAALGQSVGERVYSTRCAACHEPAAFKTMHASRILKVLNSGVMVPMAGPLSKDEREAVANYLGDRGDAPGPKPEAMCKDRRATVNTSKPSWNGWSPSPGNTRYQTASGAGLSVDAVKSLKLKWAFGFDGDLTSFSQPAVFGNQVFVGSSSGMIYALNADSGCIQWFFQVSAPVRTAMVVSTNDPRRVLMFGDQSGGFHAVEADTGKPRWNVQVDPHRAARVTGSPVVNGTVVYVPISSWEETFATQTDYDCCSFRGGVVGYSISSGREVFRAYTVPANANGGAVWSAPTIDTKRGMIYVTTGNNYSLPETAGSDAVVAFRLGDGKLMWTRQVTPNDIFGCRNCVPERGPDFDFGSSAMLVTGEHDLLIAGQKSGVVYALDPDNGGKIVWQARIAKGTSHGGVQWGMASDGQFVYAPIADGELKTTRGADGVARRGMDPEDGGGLAAIRVKDGSIAWRAAPARVCAGAPSGCSPSQLAAATAMPGAIFSGALDGHIRAYAAEDGSVLWDFATAKEFSTVNGVRANGGSINGNGAVVANGMVFVNSGYDHFGSMTGNVLLAFAP